MMTTGSDDVVASMTPPTAVSSTTLNPISHLLSQTQAMGRYPIYAAALPTGNSLLCSPAALLGQTVSPWRSGSLAISSLSAPGTTNTVATSTSSSMCGSSQQQQQVQSSLQQQQSSLQQQQQQQQQLSVGSSSPYMNLTQLAQLPAGLVCAPLGSFLQNAPPGSPQPDSSGKKTAVQDVGSSHKRRPDSSHPESEAHKRARLSEPSPQSPSLTSSSASSSPHPSTTPGPAFQPKPHPQQRSPVIKVIPYTPSQGAPLMIHTSPSSSLAQTIVFPSVNLSIGSTLSQQAQSTSVSTATTGMPSQQQQKVVNLQHLQHLQPHLQQLQQQVQSSSPSPSTGIPTATVEQSLSSTKSHLLGNSSTMVLGKQSLADASGGNGTGSGTLGVPATSLSSSHLPHSHQYLLLKQQPQQQQQHYSGGNSGSQLVLSHTTRHLLSSLRLVLLKCLGPVSESVVNQNHLVMSSFLQDLYRQSYFTTSSFSEPPLSPESCCLLTICYLSSLQRGEQISVEGLRTMIHHAQLGEMDWLNYYKKHKKMSESSFVQAQLIHLSRVAVYPVQGKVRVVISNQSLNEGVVMALQKLAQLWTSSEQNFPEYWVVLAVRPSSTIDFCVIVTDPLQVQLLMELKAMGSDTRNKKNPPGGRSQPVAAATTSHSSQTISSSSSSLSSSGVKKVSISKELLQAIQSFQEKLAGGVLIPFYQQSSMQNRDSEDLLVGMGLVRMEPGEADHFSPTSSHLVEHWPRGPFQDQYNVAMHMLQKILSSWGSQAKIDEYQRVDFRILCPNEASFLTQTMMDVVEAGLVEHLGLAGCGGGSGQNKAGKKQRGGGGGSGLADSKMSTDSSEGRASPSGMTGVSREVMNRVVCCGSSSGDSSRFRSLLKQIEEDKTTLYIIVAENSHMTNQVTAPDSSPSGGAATSFSDDAHLLCQLSNCILVNISSHPYSLQTNRSFVSFVNEIHWPISADKSSLHFCSASDFRSNQFQNLESEFEYGVRFREDQCFEEMFHECITSLGGSGGQQRTVANIRLQLLLNQYTSAMLNAVGKSSSGSCAAPGDTASPKSQYIVNKLVLGPLDSPRGHGCMVVVRAHDKAIGKTFYQKICQVRNALGLNYRFEVIYDDGSSYLKISEHFSRRLAQWKSGCRLNGVHNKPVGLVEGGTEGKGGKCTVTSYKELENLPCLVVLTGDSRAGLSFPSSLRLVDLRLCYSVGPLTRLHFEYDTSLFNGYYKVLIKPTSPVPSSPGQHNPSSKDREMPVSGVESDEMDVFDSSSGNPVANNSVAPTVEPFLGSFPAPPTLIGGSRTASTSSSRKSSYEEAGQHERKSAMAAPFHPPPSLLSRSTGRQRNESPPTNGVSRPTVVEWKPEETHSDVEVSLPSTPRNEGEGPRSAGTSEMDGKEEEEVVPSAVGVVDGCSSKDEEETYMSDVFNSTVTVTIDPPRDNGQGDDQDDPVYRYLEGGASISSTALVDGRTNYVIDGGERPVEGNRGGEEEEGERQQSEGGGEEGMWERFGAGVEEGVEGDCGGDLFDDLNDVDLSEEEDSETPPPVKLCLLSRQYYYIWFSRSAHQHLLLRPCPGVSWHGGQKRPPLFDQDPRQQSAHYRKWTKPVQKEVRSHYDGLMKQANKSSRRRFLLTGPPQVGKTGAWILMIKLLHDHLRSSLGVAVENLPLPASLFISPCLPSAGEVSMLGKENGVGGSDLDNHTPLGTISPATSRYSRIVPLDYLHGLYKKYNDETKLSKPLSLLRDTPTQSRSESSQQEVTTSGVIGGYSGRHEVVSIPISPYMMYDSSHSCNNCSKYVRGSPSSTPADYLTSILPRLWGGGSSFGGGETRGEGVVIKWRVPPGQQKHCVVNVASKTLERLKLPTVRARGEKLSSEPLTPVFTPSLGRDSCGMFNLFHEQFFNLHVIVTSEADFTSYCKAWPNHIVMALPDRATMGLGSMFHYIKEFCQYNLHLNMAVCQHESSSHVVWPYVALISDSVVMVKMLDSDSRSFVDVSLSAALKVCEQDCLQYAAIGLLPWSKQLEQEGEALMEEMERDLPTNTSSSSDPLLSSSSSPSSSAISRVAGLTDFDLSHDFVLLNLSKLAGTHYNQFSFNSAEVDFVLQLKVSLCRAKLRQNLVFVKKHLKGGGNPYPLHLDVSGLCQDADKLVISLHHDSSSHLPHPGPYLMEHYLLYKSQVLFPYAHSPHFPVLAIDNYISLGPHTHVSFIRSKMLVKAGGKGKQHVVENGTFEELSPSSQCGPIAQAASPPILVEDLSHIKFGGLLLYLCEEKLTSEHLRNLNFVSGASLCLVTRDCKSLVKEVTRLDLEEKWKFRVRDEYQTACADDMTPLYFFIGRYEG